MNAKNKSRTTTKKTIKARTALFAATAAAATAASLASVANAQTVPYPTAGANITQDFDTLPNTGTFTFAANGPYQLSDPAGSPGTGVGAANLGGWYFSKAAGTGPNALFTVGTGSSAGGSAYSFGAAAATDRALGSVASGTVISNFGALLTNTTGQTLNSFTLTYTGEQWRDGGTTTPAPNVLSFDYAVGATDLNTGTFFPANALNFTSPVISSTTGVALDGNTSPNRTVGITATVSGITWTAGSTLALRWSDADETGGDDGLGIDDLSFSAVQLAATGNLIWNPPTNTWDTNTTQNWLDSGNPAKFQVGNNVTFTDTGVGTVNVTSGVNPNNVTVSNSTGTYTFTGGSINATGALIKSGTGTASFTSDNTFTGGVTFGGGTIITSATTPLGTAAVTVTGTNTTLQTNADVNIPGGFTGTGTIHKTGTGKMTVAGTPAISNGGAFILETGSGKVQMTTGTSLGGNGTTSGLQAAMAIVLNSGTELELNYGSGSQRFGKDITLNNATITRLNGAPDGDSALETYSGINNFGGIMNISGNSTIRNQDIATGSGPAINGVNGNSLGIRYPMFLAAGATLTLQSDNNLGDFGSNAVSIRGTTRYDLFPNDGIYLAPGASIIMAGPGEKRFGAGTAGKAIIGQGTTASNAVIKLDQRSFMTDLTLNVGNKITSLVINGSGDGGLRIEAPMNATYNIPDNTQNHPLPPDGNTGFFGINTTSTMEGGTPPTGFFNIGNAYTVLSPKRWNALSDSFGSPALTPGGTLTIAATNAGSAIGLIDNGPNAPTPIKFAVDNTATSGNLAYQILPQANGGKFSNFGGLAVRRSNTGAGTVTLQMLPDGGATGVLKTGTLVIDPTAKLDLSDNHLITSSPVGSATGGVYTGVSRYVQLGRNGNTAPLWDGPGGIITSQSNATGGSFTSIGAAPAQVVKNLATASDTATWAGQTVTGSDTLVMYTYGGDANLDGRITVDDYGKIDFAVGLPGASGWFNGDFNYDGKITVDDYGIIDFNVGIQGPQLYAGAGGAGGVNGLAAVPEPATVSVLGVGAAAMLMRRRKSK